MIDLSEVADKDRGTVEEWLQRLSRAEERLDEERWKFRSLLSRSSFESMSRSQDERAPIFNELRKLHVKGI